MSRSITRSSLLAALERAGQLVAVQGELPATFTQATDDSRRTAPGALFVAVRGIQSDGHDFLAAAARAGAVAAVVEDGSRTSLPAMVVRDTRVAVGIVAASAYGDPSSELTIVGVTGTNGKTTTAWMLRHLLHEDGAPAASIGTLGVLAGSEGKVLPGGEGLTTPGPVELQRVLRALVDAGIRRVAMEVSSHSLEQRRVSGLRFAAAVFTNVTRDHLDYHGTMAAYVAAKAKLLQYLSPAGVAVINADVAEWSALPQWPRRVRFGLETHDADVTAEDVRYGATGSTWTLRCGETRAPVVLPLLGDFNVMNALGAAAAAFTVGEDPTRIGARLSVMPQVPGRLERLNDRPTVLRDYAHTPDALGRALDAVRPFVEGRLFVLFGCGGDRDRGKRPEMGAIAEQRADVVILTSDNPRTEDPERILDDIEAGTTARRHERIEDRRRAIARALELAAPDDVIVLAGKGHETYQIRGTTSHPFDERVVVAELLAGRADGASVAHDRGNHS